MEDKEARLQIGEIDETHALETTATSAPFHVTLKPGPAMPQTWLTRPDGKQHVAYYVRVRLVSGDGKVNPPE